MIEESVALMDKLGSALLSTKFVGESEPSVFKTEELSMVLDRQTPSVLVRKLFQVTGGHGGISFPSRKALIKNFPFPLDSLDVQVSDQRCHVLNTSICQCISGTVDMGKVVEHSQIGFSFGK